jgi:Ni/Fe-hydrogenase subunit HybB-like protein
MLWNHGVLLQLLCFVSERKAGLGADFWGKFFELLLVMDWVIVLALYFSSLANSSTAKYTFAIKASRSIWRRLLLVPRESL